MTVTINHIKAGLMQQYLRDWVRVRFFGNYNFTVAHCDAYFSLIAMCS